jgi:hypothetical protein
MSNETPYLPPEGNFTGSEGTLTPEQTVLLCVPMGNVREVLCAQLSSSPARLIIPSQAAEAREAMQFTVFDVVLLYEPDGDSQEILVHLNKLPLSIRRRILVGLISENDSTLDHLPALRKSVDFVLNTRDLKRLDYVLKSAFKEKNSRYFVFRQVNSQFGRG